MDHLQELIQVKLLHDGIDHQSYCKSSNYSQKLQIVMKMNSFFLDLEHDIMQQV
jgi:hypothetical protein